MLVSPEFVSSNYFQDKNLFPSGLHLKLMPFQHKLIISFHVIEDSYYFIQFFTLPFVLNFI